MKSYRVDFYNTLIGDKHFLRDGIKQLVGTKKPDGPVNLSVYALKGREFQLRDFKKVGKATWTGIFARLRDEAPNKIDTADVESTLGLLPDDRLIEKSQFIYKADQDILIWQVNTDVGFASRFTAYIAHQLNAGCDLVPIVTHDALDRVLGGGEVKFFDVSFAKPASQVSNKPVWTQSAIKLLDPLEGHSMNIRVSGGKQTLGGKVKTVLEQLARDDSVRGLKVQMQDEEEVIDLLIERVSDRIHVNLHGHYPDREEVLAGLEKSYASKQSELKPYFR